jgi:heat shock protein HslJ
VPAGSRIALSIAPPEAGGISTCNSYGTDVRVDGDEIRFGKVASTMKGCDEDLAVPEFRFYDALPKVRTWRSDGGTLTLSGPNTTLVFHAA